MHDRFDRLDPPATALVVIDMQHTFCAPGSPAEVSGSRAIVAPINALARRVLHAKEHRGGSSDWDVYFDHVVMADVRARTIESLTPGKQRFGAASSKSPVI